MSAPGSKDLRALWLDKARRLDNEGYFADYPKSKLAEILRKGYLGLWRPDAALDLARVESSRSLARYTPKIIDELRDHYAIARTVECSRFVEERLREASPEDYAPPRTLAEPPGHPYVFVSASLCQRVYLKFQIVGTAKKYQVWFWSCHPPRR